MLQKVWHKKITATNMTPKAIMVGVPETNYKFAQSQSKAQQQEIQHEVYPLRMKWYEGLPCTPHMTQK